MSTEKDREAAELEYPDFPGTELEDMRIQRHRELMRIAYIRGIQHARQGERERMIHLLCWHEDSYSDEQGLASKVDEFLEQEKS